MDLNSSTSGTIITFYSYKGGTGRSMSLANTACLLAKQIAQSSQKVLVMDWDLEAPGLHRYFAARSDQPENVARPGVINLFYKLRQLLDDTAGLYEELVSPGGWRILDTLLPLGDYLITDVVRGVDFIKAGQFDPHYSELVATFGWAEFYNRYSSIIDVLRELLSSKYAYCLIDSRTGITDVSGICTMLLPEKLVTVFTPNNQSLYGLLEVIEQAITYRRASDDFRPLAIFPLPSRIELAEKSLREQWRKQYQREFELLFRRVYEIETSELDLTAYFDEVQLPHVSYYAYGENIAVLEERSDSLSLSRAYQDFYHRLLELDEAWEIPGEVKIETILPSIKMVEERYDVYFSYNNTDRAAVEVLASRLVDSGVRVYFDVWHLRPGENYQRALETAMDESATIAVFLGQSSTGPWQNEEFQVALKARAQDPSKRIIPIILPGASPDKLPNYLRNLSSVDFRAGLDDPEEFKRLVSGILDKGAESSIPGGPSMMGTDRTVPAPPLTTARAKSPVILVALVAVAIILLAVSAFVYYSYTRPIDSIAVLPFSNVNPDSVTESLGDDITGGIIYNLSQYPELRVASVSSVVKYKGQQVDLQKVGDELGVRAVLLGRVTRRSDGLLINVEMIDTRDKSLILGIQRPTNFSDLMLVPEEIAASVSAKLGLKLSEEEQKKRDAQSLYVKGRNAWNKRTADGIKEGISYFEQAIARYPNYALAYAGLADCYNMLATYGASSPTEAFPKARNAATRALVIDNTLAEGHAALAYTIFRGDWDWSEAEKEFKQAILLDPNYAPVHQWYANYLAAMSRFDEALQETRRAQEIDSTSLVVNAQFGLIYYFAHRFDDAIAQCQKTLELDPTFFVARRYLSLAYAQKGMYKEALEEAQKAIAASGDSPLMKAEYAHALALSGDTSKALAELDSLAELSKERYISSYHIAAIYVALKDKDLAFKWLEKAYQQRADWMVFLAIDPRFDSLHSDPKFVDLYLRQRLHFK